MRQRQENVMPTEPDYRNLLQKAQQCTDDVKQFLVAVCNSPQGKSNEVVLSAAALTVEHLRMVEGEISHIWELFQQGESATLTPSLSEPAPTAQPEGTKPKNKPVRLS
jgi:hypothetical protein